MSTTFESLGIDRLSVAERLLLVQDIWDSIPGDEIALTDEQKTDLERRIAEHETNPADVILWEDALAELRNVK